MLDRAIKVPRSSGEPNPLASFLPNDPQHLIQDSLVYFQPQMFYSCIQYRRADHPRAKTPKCQMGQQVVSSSEQEIRSDPCRPPSASPCDEYAQVGPPGLLPHHQHDASQTPDQCQLTRSEFE